MSQLAKLKSVVTSRIGLKTGALLATALVAVLISAPTSKNSTTLAESCPNPTANAVLNHFPVSYADPAPACTDFATIDGALTTDTHYSNSAADQADGLTVADGKEFYILTYVHNGAAQNADPATATAKNVKLNVTVPTTASADHTITAAWKGDNTNTASGTFVIHTPATGTLQIVANSGELFDTFGNKLASGIDVSSGSYTLGDQQACYEFSRFLRFKVKVVTPVVAPTLTVTKQVRNVTANGTFAKTTTAATNDTVQYQISVKNNGTTTATNTTVVDSGTNGTTFTAGSMTLPAGVTGTTIPGTVTIGDLAAGATTTFTYSAKVTGSTGTYTNTATAQATGVAAVNDTATVTVPAVNNNTTLTLTKTVRNQTQNGTFAKTANLSISDSAQYQVVIKNTGTVTAKNVVMADSGTPGTTFNTGSLDFGGGNFTGSIPGTITIGDIAVGQSVTIKYSMRVTGVAGTYTNTATANSSNAGQASDTATIVVTNPQINPAISVTKQVRNVTTNNTLSKSTNASTGDTVEYQLVVKNTGDIPLTNTVVTDAPPAGISLVNGSLVISKANAGGNLTTTGAVLGTLAVNETVTLTYRATVTGGTGTYTNTVKAEATEVKPVTDTANVVVVPPTGTRSLTVNKVVRNLTNNGNYENSVTATAGQRVQWQITVTNTGSLTTTNTFVTDILPAGLTPDTTSLALDGTLINFNSINNIALGTLNPNQSRTVTFVSTVNTVTGTCTTATTLQNIAKAYADSVGTVQDDAFVNVPCNGQTPNLVFSKKAFNDTKNVDATSKDAAREDFITYSLTVSNTGNGVASGFIVTDDLSGVLPFADMVDLNGGSLTGNVISYPALDIPAGGSVTKTFKVRIKFSLDKNLSYVLRNTYGNTVTVNVPGSGTFVPPKTGADASTTAAVFGGAAVLAFVAYKKREYIMNLILA